MVKKRRQFSVVDTEMPKSHILDKFTMGNEVKPKEPVDVPKPTPEPGPDKAKQAAFSQPKKKAPALPKAEPTATAPSINSTPTDETVVVNFKAGVPVSLAARFSELKAESGMTEDYLMDWSFARALKIMEKIDIATLSLALEGPKTVEPSRAKRLHVRRDALDRFRASHDPLEVFKNVDCCRLIYIAAFKEALEELAGKLNL